MASSKFFALASLFLAAVSASPCTPPADNTTIPAGTPFNIMAIRSGSEVHYAGFQAAKSSIFVNLPDQGAGCDAGFKGPAIFTLTSDGELYLYTDNPPQKLFADRSGMGQGKLGYVTGAEPLGRNWETTGFQIDSEDHLTLKGAGFIACPNSIDGAWSIWVDAGVANPAGNSDCVGIAARVIENTEPAKCMYTS